MQGKGINAEEYNKLKQMLSLGLTAKQIEKITGRSKATTVRIKQSEDYAGYKAIIERHNPNATVKPVTATPDALSQNDTAGIEAKLDTVIALLQRLVILCEDRRDEAVTERRGLFGKKQVVHD